MKPPSPTRFFKVYTDRCSKPMYVMLVNIKNVFTDFVVYERDRLVSIGCLVGGMSKSIIFSLLIFFVWFVELNELIYHHLISHSYIVSTNIGIGSFHQI